jgi:(2Fe-2S) ferredoxin
MAALWKGDAWKVAGSSRGCPRSSTLFGRIEVPARCYFHRVSILPEMESYSRHVLVCTGGFCSPDRRGRALYARLAELLEREGLLFGPTRVKRSETPCLGVCSSGPIVAVYPDGIWYAGVTPALLERIVIEHLRDGKVVGEAVFHRLGA